MALSLGLTLIHIIYFKINIMKLRKLTSGSFPLIILLLGTLIIAACNNSDKEENSSTTTTGTSLNGAMVDTSRNEINNNVSTNRDTNGSTTTTSTTTKKTTTAKKTGKVYARPILADANAKTEMSNAGLSTYPDVMPVYPGGQMALENYISNNLEYPEDAIDNNAEGTVYIVFSIDENGSVSNAKLAGSKLGYGMDEAALKVISQMPKWTPGKLKGKAVKAWFTFPVTFRLE